MTPPASGPDPELEAALEKPLCSASARSSPFASAAISAGPQIAELTGLSADNVQQILSRSLRGLRDALKGSGLEP